MATGVDTKACRRKRRAALSESQITRAAAELERDGVCVLRGLLDRTLVARWAEAFDALVERRRGIPGLVAPRGNGRFYTTLPFTSPFADPGVYAHPGILAVIGRVLMDDFVLVQMAADTPVLGSELQEVHRDFLPLFGEGVATPMYALAVNFALCDVTEDNGPFVMARGTHLLPRDVADAKVASGEIPLEPFLMEMGDVMIRSPFALHRGTPNRTTAPRPMVVLGYVRRWLHTADVRLSVPRQAYEALDGRLQQLLRCDVVEELVERPETYVHFKY